MELALLRRRRAQDRKAAGSSASIASREYVKVAFFRGTSLRPMPPGESKHREVRYLDIHEHDELDEAQLARWVKHASRLPGERM